MPTLAELVIILITVVIIFGFGRIGRLGDFIQRLVEGNKADED